jgi:hypothetical protein
MVLSACATGTTETARTVPDEPAAIRARIEAELSRLGFRPVSGGPDTSLEATADTTAVDWAACPPVLVDSDGSERKRRMTTAGRRWASVEISLARADGGTAVRVAAEFAATYRNPISNYSFERACRSKGVVEARVLEAALGLSGPRTL